MSLRELLTVLRGDRALAAGVVIVAISLLLAAIGPWIVPFDPERATGEVLLAPSLEHPFGTDASGIDVFSRVVAGFRADVTIAIVAVALSLAGGVVLGALAGFDFRSPWAGRGRWTILRLADMVQALPVFILALALVGMTGPSVRNVIVAIAFVNLPIFLRLTRGAVLVTQREAYVDAARVMGLPSRVTLRRHVLPNSMEPVIANASITVGFAVLLTAGLSFLGAGVRPPTPEWGATIASGSRNLVTGEWWISVLPGLVLSVVVLGFALLGEGLRRRWSPADRTAGDPRLQAGPR
ncbi:ABC transporter permease [Conexibacter arvalis]|uniref:Peptide/nickel transport system permease protein n=1 Tax=Conexibacter arvalis TaxID=912552 RepID=A0A840IDF9_9ACTN|nr:ABC transporter permease [Conexibacter arvalis]MBB4662104.1 peptide/nickel transport system permease protein [Conexibacter arvalis]